MINYWYAKINLVLKFKNFLKKIIFSQIMDQNKKELVLQSYIYFSLGVSFLISSTLKN